MTRKRANAKQPVIEDSVTCELASQVSRYFDMRVATKDFSNWNDCYEMQRISAALQKEQTPAQFIKALNWAQGSELPAEIPAILVSHPSAKVRREAVLKLFVSFGEEECVEGALRKAIGDSDASVRAAAVNKIRQLLTSYRCTFFLELLNEAAKDQDPTVIRSLQGAQDSVEHHKPHWEKSEELSPLACKVLDQLVKEEIPRDYDNNKIAEMMRFSFANWSNLHNPAQPTDDLPHMVLLWAFGEPDSGDKCLVEARPESAKDCIAYALKLRELYLCPARLDVLGADGKTFEHHSLPPNTRMAEKVTYLLCEHAIHTGSPESIAALLEIYNSKSADSVEKENAVYAIVSANDMHPNGAAEKAFESLQKADVEKAAGKIAKLTAQAAAAEAEPNAGPHPFGADDFKILKDLGDVGINNALSMYEKGEIPFSEVIRLCVELKSQYATQLLWTFYSNLYFSENPTNDVSSSMMYGHAPSVADQRAADHMVAAFKAMSAFLGAGPSPGSRQLSEIGKALAQMDLPSTIEPLAERMPTDQHARIALVYCGANGTALMKKIAGDEKNAFAQRAAAIGVLARKEEYAFLNELFHKTNDPHVELAIAASSAVMGSKDVPDFLREILASPNQATNSAKLRGITDLARSVPLVSKNALEGSRVTVSLKSAYPVFELKTVHACTASIFGWVAASEPVTELCRKHLGDESIQALVRMVQEHAMEMADHFWTTPPIGVGLTQMQEVATAFSKCGKTPFALEFFALNETRQDSQIAEIINAHLHTMDQSRGNGEHILESLSRTEEDRAAEANARVAAALHTPPVQLETITDSDLPEIIPDVFRDKLGHFPCIACNSHQLAVYTLGSLALGGDDAALEIIRTLGAASLDEHARKLSEMILDHAVPPT